MAFYRFSANTIILITAKLTSFLCDKIFLHFILKLNFYHKVSSVENETGGSLMIQVLDHMANTLKFSIQVLSMFAGKVKMYVVRHCHSG